MVKFSVIIMGEGIERKYLIREEGLDYAKDALFQLYESVDSLIDDVYEHGKRIRQGYLPENIGMELATRLQMSVDFDPKEARLRDKDGKFYFTLKGEGGLSRSELETKITSKLFDKYWLGTEGRRIEKVRLKVPYRGHVVEIDVYTDRDLIVAEVDVPTLADAERLVPLGKDVTKDSKYKNKNLAR